MHTLPLVPQFFGSVCRSTHWPPTHENPDAHVVRHDPQWDVFVCVFMHRPPQHCDPTPNSSAGHTTPQAPHDFESVFKSTHWLPHWVPVVHVHTPLKHNWFAVHELMQLPHAVWLLVKLTQILLQLERLTSEQTQKPPRHICPAAVLHTDPTRNNSA